MLRFQKPFKLYEREVYLGSGDSAISGDDNSTYKFDMTKWILPSFQNDVFEIALHRVVFTNTHYPINKFNNNFYYSINDGVKQLLTITPGFYTIDEIRVLLQNGMNLANPGTPITWTVNPNTKCLHFDFLPGIFVMKYFNDANNINRELGLLEFETDYSSYDSPEPYDVSGPSCMLITSNLSQYALHSQGTSVLAEIPISATFGYQVVYETQHPVYCPLHTNQSYIEFHLIDSRTNLPFTLSKGTDLRFKFVIRPIE